MTPTIIGGLAGALALHIFFTVIKTNWPSSYYSLGDSTSFRISSSPVAYCLFRFLPVLVVVLFKEVHQ